jgi:hypothetical protein
MRGSLLLPHVELLDVLFDCAHILCLPIHAHSHRVEAVLAAFAVIRQYLDSRFAIDEAEGGMVAAEARFVAAARGSVAAWRPEVRLLVAVMLLNGVGDGCFRRGGNTARYYELFHDGYFCGLLPGLKFRGYFRLITLQIYIVCTCRASFSTIIFQEKVLKFLNA